MQMTVNVVRCRRTLTYW